MRVQGSDPCRHILAMYLPRHCGNLEHEDLEGEGEREGVVKSITAPNYPCKTT